MIAQSAKAATSAKKHAAEIDRTLRALAKRASSARKSIEQAKKRSDKTETAHRDAREKMSRLAAERDAIEGAIQIVQTQQQAIERERQLGAQDLEQAQAWLIKARRRLQKDKLAGALKRLAAESDRRIDALTEGIASMEKDAKAAEIATSAAEQRAAQTDRLRREAEETLRRLPGEIRAARERLSTLVQTLQGATVTDTWRLEAAERQIHDAVEAVRDHLRSAKEQAAIGHLLSTMNGDHRVEVERASERLASFRSALADAQTARQRLIEKRETDIKELILRKQGSMA